METKPAAGQLVYEDFVPPHKSVPEEGIDTIVVELPEFKKEEIRVQLDSFGKVRISGERPLADNRRSRFHKEIQASVVDCNEVRTRFENGRLHVKMFPSAKEKAAIKIIKETNAKDLQPTQTQQPKTPKPSAGKDDTNVPKKKQEDGKELAKLSDTSKGAEKVGEKGKDQTQEKKDEEKLKVLESGFGFSKPMLLLVNIIVALVVLLVMALYITSKN